MRNRRHVPAALVAVLLLAAGCGGDDGPAAPAPSADPRPTSPREVVFRYMAAHEQRDFAAYAALVDTGYRIHLTAATVQEYALPRSWFDAAEDLASAARMLSGQGYAPPGGAPVPGIAAIEFHLVEQQVDWAETEQTHEFPGELAAPFRVDADVEFADGLRLAVQGVLEFVVRGEAVEEDGAPVTRYTLLGLVDYTGYAGAKRGIEHPAWGGIKAMFR